MMPVDPSAQAMQLAAMVRARLATPSRAAAKRAAPEAIAPATMERQADAGTRAARRQQQQMVALRVQALSPDDPQRQRKAFRIFLASVLAQALGPERLGAPGTDQLLDAVLQQMEGDAELEAVLHEAGRLLLADAAASATPPRGASGTA